MSVNRKRFRVEQAILGDAPIEMPMGADVDVGPMHREIMNELRAIRAQMAAPVRSQTPEALQDAANRELAETQSLLDTYRAQIEQCEKLKIELDLIHDAINRTKREIAVLHGKSFNGDEMAKVNGELGAVVGGTEQATQQILAAAEEIDEAANNLSALVKRGPEQALAQDIREQVIRIYEACNFQDLAGQRITKVLTTLKFVDDHVTRMIDIWGGVEAFKDVAAAVAPRQGAPINGPKLDGDAGHASQDEIDALFGAK
jgi:chemotaxis protein CheZ